MSEIGSGNSSAKLSSESGFNEAIVPFASGLRKLANSLHGYTEKADELEKTVSNLENTIDVCAQQFQVRRASNTIGLPGILFSSSVFAYPSRS